METVRFVFRCEEVFDLYEQKENTQQETDGVHLLKEELLNALVGLAKSCRNGVCAGETMELILEGLGAAAINVDRTGEQLKELIKRVQEEVEKAAHGCADKCGDTGVFDVRKLREEDADVSSVKYMILLGICGMAVDACQAEEAGQKDEELNRFFIKALSMISCDLEMEELFPVMIEAGEMNFKCIELLDNANNEKSTTAILLEESHPAENGNSRGLPFSIGFSWQETKTVCFFLTLLYLGNRPVYVGRRLPSFLSENVIRYMVEHYNVALLDADED